MHVSTRIHDTVLEEDNDLSKGNAAHRLYGSTSAGNKVGHTLMYTHTLAEARVCLH